MKENLKISLIQSNIFWENTEKNLAHFTSLISNIKQPDLILLPEMFNTAFCPNSKNLAENINGKTIRWMKKIAKEKMCSITGSIMVKDNLNIYNRLIWVEKNGSIYTYDKRHLFSLIKENKYLTKGEKRLIVELDGWKICPLICYDLRFPVFSRNDVGYDILIYLANWPTKRVDAWNTLLKARAIENQCYAIGVNRIGEDGNGVPFNGSSQVFDAFGKKLATAKNKQVVLEIVISKSNLNLKRRQMNFLKDRDSFILQ